MSLEDNNGRMLTSAECDDLPLWKSDNLNQQRRSKRASKTIALLEEKIEKLEKLV